MTEAPREVAIAAIAALTLICLMATLKGCYVSENETAIERLRIERACPAPSPKAGAQ